MALHRSFSEENRMLLPSGGPDRGDTSAEQEPILKGSPDVPMLLITTILLLFGCVMVYSASAVYAEKYHDDSTYFIVRHLIFLLLAVAATALIVRYVTPRFWEDFTLVIFAVSILL